MSKQIQLTKGYVAIVDDEDFDWLSGFKWISYEAANKICYARSKIKGRYVTMHRLILHYYGLLEDCLVVDHIDHNGLNNQKDNLRVCTRMENLRNRKGPFKNGYRGICKSRSKKNPWRAQIMVNRKQIYLGVFATKKEAARAYDQAAPIYHREFATLNFPQEGGVS